MNTLTILLYDFYPSINDFRWPDSFISGAFNENEKVNSQQLVTKHFFNDVLRCHFRHNLIGNEIH